MHEHIQTCNHDIKFCPQCDICYCFLCGKEWYVYKTIYSPYEPNFTYLNDTILVKDHKHV